MINFQESHIALLYVHFIGRYTEQEGVKLTEEAVPVNEDLQSSLGAYFFEQFKEPSFYNFTFSDGNPEMNPLYVYARTIFENPESFPELSQTIAKYLYDNSRHPNIKSGDLMMAYVQDLLIDDEMVDGICIFKSENKQAFITMNYMGGKYDLDQKYGINAGKLDKACIIFNTEESSGYKICALDRSNKNQDAQFWITDFLNVTPRSDDYHHTKNYIQATKGFINDRLIPLHEIDKTVEADILHHSHNYLKGEEDFHSGSYEQKVFRDEGIIQEFQEYKKDFQSERNVNLEDSFSVNRSAVKNQSKVFKSVLKLDKNFHVYIHGDRSMIERGTDDDGRKFYKLYYDKEA